MKQEYKFDIFSIMVSVIILITLSLGALLLSGFMGEFGDQIKEDALEMDISTENAETSTDFLANDIEKYNDNYVFWFFLATFISLILMSMYLEFEPAIVIILFIVGSIGVLGAWLGSEIYSGFSEEVVLGAEMTKTEILMGGPYFPIFIFVGLIIMLIIMYNKKSGGYQ